MEKAYLRELKYANQCELVFPLKLLNDNLEVLVETEIRSVRACTDVIESLLTHTENKIIKILETEEAECDIDIKSSLTVDGEHVNGDTNCKEFIDTHKENIVFSLLNQKFEVIINAPLVQDLALPKVIQLDYEFQPMKFKHIYTNKEACDFIWYTSIDKEIWEKVGNKFRYKPTEKDFGKYLKLKCIPKTSRNQEGPPFEVISETTVSKIPDIPVCPFDKRHEYTKTFLPYHQIRVVSYNVLSNLYAENNAHPNCPLQFLTIDYRKQLIVRELVGFKADIICLQEVDFHIFSSYYTKKVTSKYKGMYHKKGNTMPEGLACFFNVNRFRLVESKHLVFSEELGANPLFNDTWEILNDCETLKDTLMKQKTSLQLTILKPLSGNEIIIVANTHLYFHSEATQVRLLQANVVLVYIYDVYLKYKRQTNHRISVLLCGDFNSVPSSLVYEFIVNGTVQTTLELENEVQKQICLNHPFKFASACGTPEYTNYTVEFKGCLDYIFYDKTRFELVEFVPLPDEKLLEEKVALPNQVFPSDHLALVCSLQYRHKL
ncbi:hypothetical protein FQR65_LT13078 [Abscondita terminalis]|nr:hypothetical protein FQR65_LT13078 [Abscondita terminalis]